jgi:23S rRNA pseudoU1915 N3-methylase RlmH
LDADRAATALLLDAAGKAYDSQALAEWLGKQRDQGTREIIFVCGDAEGFPEALRQRVPRKSSFTALSRFSPEVLIPSEILEWLTLRVVPRKSRSRAAS